MANALKNAPLTKEFIEIEGEKVVKGSKEHLALTKEFDPTRRYVFERANKNPARDLPIINVRTHKIVDHQEYSPLLNLVFTSQVVWNGQRRMVRYYDGCDSIFFDKQPKEKEIIEQLLRQTRRREFVYGKIAIEGFEKMLLLYMTICSWNAESPFRTPRANMIFIPVNAEDAAETELEKLDNDEKALQYAKEAPLHKMKVHLAHFGISLIDYDSGAELTEKELRVKYRRYAVDNSSEFLKSYGNEKIEVKFFIDKALEKGVIKTNPNKAIWGNSGSVICDVSGLKSNEAISQKLFEFSQLDEGADFLVQLKAISEQL